MSCEPDYPTNVTVVRREKWGAKPAQKVDGEPLRPLRAPVGQVFFNDTASSVCDNLEECSRTLQDIQANHMLIDWPDITHNFMVSGDAVVYEGRGWAVEPDAMDSELRGDVIDIAFIGNYERLMPLPNVISCAEKLIEHGVKIGKVKSDYKIRWLTYYN